MHPNVHFGPGPFELIIVLLAVGLSLLITVLPFWLICTKAGFPGWYALAMLFPCLNILLLFFLAFAEWPALQQTPGAPQQHQ